MLGQVAGTLFSMGEVLTQRHSLGGFLDLHSTPEWQESSTSAIHQWKFYTIYRMFLHSHSIRPEKVSQCK
jgi:hypothetical protein